LRAHTSQREKLAITGVYYEFATGELDKAIQTYQEYIESFPRKAAPYTGLGLTFAAQGQYEKESGQTTLRG
jgi:tetratricopeptide (TPR) repeat protein